MSQTEGQLVKAQPEVVDTDKFLQVQSFIGEALQKVIVENNTKLAGSQSYSYKECTWRDGNVVSSERAERRRTLPQAGQPDQTAAADQTRECEDITGWKVEKIAGRIA